LYVGSPQSKESSEGMEAKIDLLIKNMEELTDNPEKVKAMINEIDRKYYKNS
jgi:hypothetical protein